MGKRATSDRPCLAQRDMGPLCLRFLCLGFFCLGFLCLGLNGLILPCALSAPAHARGESTARRGVAPVAQSNPAEPAIGEREVRLEQLWQVGERPDDPIFGIITSVLRDGDGNVGVLDVQQHAFLIFDQEGGLLRRIGRRGQGPGEFERASGICTLPGGGYGVVQPIPGKILRFDAQGLPSGSSTPRPDSLMTASSFFVTHQAAPCGERLVIYCLSQAFREYRTFARETLALIALDGTIVSRLVEIENEIDLDRRYFFDEATTGLLPKRWIVSPENAIYAAPAFHDYLIRVFDADGHEVMVITRAYEAFGRTAAEKARIMFLHAVSADQGEIDDLHRAIEQLSIGPGGVLWVLPSRGLWRLPVGTVGRYDVYAPDGVFRERVTLLGDADPMLDDIWVLGDRVIVIRNAKAALAGQLGGIGGDRWSFTGSDESSAVSSDGSSGRALGRDPEEPVSIICYAVPGR